MPILANAKKALRVSKRKATINSRIKSKMRTMLKKFRANPTQELLASTFSAIDRAAKRNVIPKNKAARLKSQISDQLPKK